MCGFQNDLVHQSGAFAQAGRDLTRIQAILPRAQGLLTRARRKAFPIMHVVESWPGAGYTDSTEWRERRKQLCFQDNYCLEGSWGESFLSGFEPEPGEDVVEHFRPSALSDTRLEVLLRARDIETLLLAGVESHTTILATATHAVCKDYRVRVASNCVASSSQDVHVAAMDLLSVWGDLVVADKALG